MSTERDESGTPESARPRPPRIGEPAPPFEAVTTDGTLRLEDYRGRWLILFSHPADFTPVCTTEFVGFAEIHPELQERNVDLLGLSVDSVYSHIAWMLNIKANLDVEIPFPVIADLDMTVARAYGMIMPGESSTEASRCVFVIDPDGIVRAMIYYPLTTGRNMQEILRLIDALQTADEHKVATPVDWEPGDRVILPPPRTHADAAHRLGHPEEACECTDWYLCRKHIERGH